MKINLTFFLEIANFLITYWFLKKFLFKPVLKSIRLKNRFREENLERLDLKKNVVLGLENLKKEKLLSFRIQTKNKYEFWDLEEPKIPSKIYYDVDKKLVKKLLDVTTAILEQRVPHVD